MRKFSVSVLTAIVAFTGFSALAPSASAQEQCGYYLIQEGLDPFGNSKSTSYYKHCGSGNVKIQVDGNFAYPSRTMCVGPGITRLNVNLSGFGNAVVKNAYYIGGC
ncbi:hypothetical protein N24_1614 [Corynebacterium suranareeae]|uniref:Secreted protein n=1 Tax=Corynebacterium suranareeae TaxID=2506452 RepID=A0A160PQK1_9CORY|nr:hypothetical protein N24_1614 [Corynebacterium suranareeae]